MTCADGFRGGRGQKPEIRVLKGQREVRIWKQQLMRRENTERGGRRERGAVGVGAFQGMGLLCC